MEYRVLQREDISKFVQIDRTESVDQIYYMRGGTLVMEKEHWDVPDWSLSEKQQRIVGLKESYDRGASIYSAFDGLMLVGLSVLDHNPIPSGVDRFNLAGLWVSHSYRGKGIGRRLCQFIKQGARELGARALYVSATPSENTVRFYKSVGFQLAELIDQDLYEKEPEDIHMELILL